MLRDRAQDAKDDRQGFCRPAVSVIRLAQVKLLAEEADDRAVEIAAGIVERRGKALQLGHVVRRQGLHHLAAPGRYRNRQRQPVEPWRMLLADKLVEQRVKPLSPRGFCIDRQE